MSNYEIYIAILIMALVNYFTRLFPFLFFRKKELPLYIVFIEKYFPPIIMTILIFYTLKDIDFVKELYAIKEIVSIFLTILLHILFKNYLLSIFIGTICYMSLVQYF